MRRAERGFSLAEVLAALLILTLVLTTSMLAFLERNNRLRQASELVLVYQVLANEAEFRRRIDFSDLDASKKSFIADTEILTPLAPYGTAVTVVHQQPGIKNVTLKVRWHDGKREASLELVRVDTGGTNLW
jgi:prepilin-type N-terminal cleavage/methylation domain-containing protein